LGLLAAGETQDSILRNYPYLEKEDFIEALAYAALLADERGVSWSRWNQMYWSPQSV